MTCYKCGCELPTGDISGECEYGCNNQKSAADSPQKLGAPDFMTLMILFNREVVAADPERFKNCLASFQRELQRITHYTGLAKFCRPQKP